MDMVFQDLITFAIQQQASDLHLSPNLPLWLRCKGELRVFTEHIVNVLEIENLCINLLNEQQKQQLTSLSHLDFGYQLENGIRLRINLFHQLRGLSCVIRIIQEKIPALNELPAPQILSELVQEKHGLLLVTGPTGSGKSTTLAAMVAEINQNTGKHILTLEDPIEYIHTNQKSLITQRERYTHFMDYPHALRNALREDPDVILISEIRDTETMQMALTAAETGHLVLATLHTPTAANTIHRIIDMFPAAQQSIARNLVAESLLAVVSQKLVTRAEKRFADFEILRATPAVRQLIRDQNISQLITAMQTGAALGMKTF